LDLQFLLLTLLDRLLQHLIVPKREVQKLLPLHLLEPLDACTHFYVLIKLIIDLQLHLGGLLLGGNLIPLKA